MIEINYWRDITKKLEKEGKLEIIDNSNYFQEIIKMNEAMEKVRNEFIYKNAMSEIDASKCQVYQKYK